MDDILKTSKKEKTSRDPDLDIDNYSSDDDSVSPVRADTTTRQRGTPTRPARGPGSRGGKEFR